MRPAVFLDRDGTLIEHVHHLTDPHGVRLIPGAAKALAVLHQAGYACIVVTNQSVIGRGKLTVEELHEIHDVINELWAQQGVHLDDIYFCPVVPTHTNATVVEHPDRKPGPGMLLRAASELELDLSRSWMVGDMISDMFAGRNAGCRGTILVRTGCNETVDQAHPAIDHVVDDLPAAAELVLAENRDPQAPDYRWRGRVG